MAAKLHIVVTLSHSQHIKCQKFSQHVDLCHHKWLLMWHFLTLNSEFYFSINDLFFKCPNSDRLLLCMSFSMLSIPLNSFICWTTMVAEEILVEINNNINQNKFTYPIRSSSSIEEKSIICENMIEPNKMKPIIIFQLNGFNSFGLIPNITNFSWINWKIFIFFVFWCVKKIFNFWRVWPFSRLYKKVLIQLVICRFNLWLNH